MERAMVALPRALRLSLCALGVAGGLVLLGLAFGSLSASADESGSSAPASPVSSSPARPGLLGSVGSLLGAVTTPVSSTVHAVTSSVTSTVSSIVNPVVPAATAPANPVTPPDAASTPTPSGPVTQTVAPVTGALDQLIGGVPVVGPVIGSTLGSVSDITAPLTGVVDKLLIYPQNMRKNLDRLGGLHNSQRVLLALTQAGASREDAYTMVQRNAMRTWEHGEDFLTNLLADKDVAEKLAASELKAMSDEGYHFKHVDTIFRPVFGEA